jgi:hypothetical protein
MIRENRLVLRRHRSREREDESSSGDTNDTENFVHAILFITLLPRTRFA